jgi:hypothetical protein
VVFHSIHSALYTQGLIEMRIGFFVLSCLVLAASSAVASTVIAAEPATKPQTQTASATVPSATSQGIPVSGRQALSSAVRQTIGCSRSSTTDFGLLTIRADSNTVEFTRIGAGQNSSAWNPARAGQPLPSTRREARRCKS